MTNKYFSKYLLCLLLLLIPVGCSDNNNTVDISEKDTLNINIGNEPPTLDWSRATDSTSFTILNNIMEGLTRFSSEHRPEPALAKSWEMSEDGRTYIFKLRKDVYWTDGKQLTSDDFIYSWKRLLSPETAADYAYFLYDITNAERFNTGEITDFKKVGVTAPDKHTLKVELNRPAVYFPSLLTFMSTFPMRGDIVEKHGDSWTEARNIVTLGAYKVRSWKHHDSIVIEEYGNYWGQKPKDAKKVNMIMNQNPTSTLALYESGELDFLDSSGLPLLEIPRLKNSEDFTSKLAYRGSYIAFNVKKKPFDNKLVRKAFGHSIDRKSIVNLLQGAGIPATSWIPKKMFAHNPEIGLEFNPDKAKKLLALAGYPNGKDFPETSFLYPDVSNNRIIAEAVQSMWKSHLGIEVSLVNQEWKVYLRTLDTDAPPIFRASWGADYPDPHNFMNLFKCKSGNNETGWCNPGYDKLVDKAAGETDRDKRLQLYNRAQRLLTEEDAPIVPYINAVQQNMIKPYVKGLEPDPLNLIYFSRVEFVKPSSP